VGSARYRGGSFVHEVRTFDHHLPASGKVDQSEAIIICTLSLFLPVHWNLKAYKLFELLITKHIN
jgi:hypothetical protein